MHSDTPTYLLLGPVAATDERGHPLDLGGTQRRAVLAQLVLAKGRMVSVDALCEGLWADRLPPSAVKSIQVHISRLRSSLPADVLVTCGPGYMLRAADGSDVARFEAILEQAQLLSAAGDHGQASDTLRSALALWRGPALADVADLPFAAGHVAQLEEARLQALEHRIGADLTLGRHTELVGELESLVLAHPLRERLWGQLMTTLYRCDRQAEALGAFSRARRHLIDELGLEPGPALREIERQILTEDVALRTTVAQPAPRSSTAGAPAGLRTSGPVVGRAAQLALLRSAFAEVVASGSAGVAVVRGDEGLGKTSLVSAFASSLSGRAPVLHGRCREHLVSPFGLWNDVVRQLGAEPALTQDLGGGGAGVESPERRRARLFEGVVSRLRAESAAGSVVVVLDDLHWSDDASVSLLLHALDELAGDAVFFVLAWRDREIAVGHPVTRVVHRLARRSTIYVDLKPLEPADIVELLALQDLSPGAGQERLDAVASVIHDVTSGVPLFVAEVVGALRTTYDDLPDPRELALDIPETIRSLVALRLTQAGPVVTEVAEAATVLAEHFGPAVLGALLPAMPATDLVLALDTLTDAGLVHEDDDEYAFEHAAFRRAIDAGMRAGRRQLLHAAAYRVLEQQGVAPALLVHHSERAGALLPHTEHLRQLLHAGEDAMGRGAFVEAAEFFRRAAERSGPTQQARVRVSHADALWRAGDITAAKAVAAGVVSQALREPVPDGTLTDAVVLHGTFGDGFGPDLASLEAVEAALSVVSDPRERARLTVARAYHHAMWGSPVAVALDSVTRAKASLPSPCPPGVAGEVLFAECLALLGSPGLSGRRRLADELVALGRKTVSLRDIGRGLRIRCLVHMCAGELHDLEGTLGELLDVADRTGSWLYKSDAWRWRVAAALAAGDDDSAAAGLQELDRVSASPLAGRAFVGTQRLLMQWYRGDFAACLTAVEALCAALPEVAQAPDRRPLDLFRLLLLVRLDRTDEAHEEVARLPLPGFLDEASPRRYTAELVLIAELVTWLGRVDMAGSLIERLEPFSGQLLVLSWGEVVLGAADRYVAQLRSLASGRVDDASFRRAVAQEEAAGAAGESARTRAAWRRAESTKPSRVGT